MFVRINFAYATLCMYVHMFTFMSVVLYVCSTIHLYVYVLHVCIGLCFCIGMNYKQIHTHYFTQLVMCIANNVD